MNIFCPRCSAFNAIDKLRPGVKTKLYSLFRETTDKDGKPVTLVTCNACGYEFNPDKPGEINFDPKQTSDVKNRRFPAILLRVICFFGVFFGAIGSWAAYPDSIVFVSVGIFVTLIFLFVALAIKVPPKRKWNKNTVQGTIV